MIKKLLSSKNVRQFISYFGVGGAAALVTDWKISPMNQVSVPGIAGLEMMFKQLDIIKVTLMSFGVFFLIVLVSWICLNPGRNMKGSESQRFRRTAAERSRYRFAI